MKAPRPGEVIAVGGRRYVLAPDAASRRLPPSSHDVAVLGRSDGVFFFTASDALARLRAAHPGLPVYGFWQVMFASRLVDHGHRLQAVCFDRFGNGQYLYREPESESLFIGELRDGMPIPAPGCSFACDTIKILAPACEDLREPPAETLVAHVARRRPAGRRAWAGVACGALLLAMGGAALNEYARHAEQAERAARYAALGAEVGRLLGRRDALNARRVAVWPAQWRTLRPFARLAASGYAFDVWSAGLARGAFEATLTVAPGQPEPDALAAELGARQHTTPAGRVKLQWPSP